MKRPPHSDRCSKSDPSTCCENCVRLFHSPPRTESKNRTAPPKGEDTPAPWTDGVTDEQIDQAPTPDADGPPVQEPDGDGDGKEKKGGSAATMIVASAQAAGTVLFHTPDQVPFVRIKVGEHHEVYPIQGTVFRHWLSGLYFKATKRAANANAIAEAVATLAAFAVHDPEMKSKSTPELHATGTRSTWTWLTQNGAPSRSLATAGRWSPIRR